MLARSILLIATFAAAPLAAQAPQDALEPDQPIAAAPPGTLGAAQAAAARGDQPEALSQYLHVLSSQPNNVAALAGAGRAALAVGDINAATGFFARAEDLAPTDGSVKAGLASATVQTGNARAALRYFRQALALGVPPATIASDRGLAYDLAGDNRRAQAEYRIALAANPGNVVATRRLALSQAISGDQGGAMLTLDPLLRRQDVPAWRTRAFVKALAGDVAGAEADAALVLPPNQAATIRPYLVRLAALKSSDKAAAVFLGRFPTPGAGRGTTVARSTAPTLPRVLTAPPTTQAITPAPAPVAAAGRSYSLPSKASTPTAALATLAEATPSTSPALAAPAPATTKPAETDVEDSPAMRAHMRAVAAAKAKSDAAAKRAEALAQQKKKQAAEEEKARKENPARHWVQVAGGANKADLPRAWSQLKTKWSTQLSGRSPWTMHYRYTNRLLIGPFKTSDEAQDWVSARKKEGFATFRVETNAGDEVEKLRGRVAEAQHVAARLRRASAPCAPPMALAPYASDPARSRGRRFGATDGRSDTPRDAFQRDRDRIIHSIAFRRLRHKTQVFVAPDGDHFRVRLTHSLEVAQIGRVIARALGLNEDLTEALCLAHDIGHPPFGHAGEAALKAAMTHAGGFDHNAHTLRVLERLESPYPDHDGLNLSWETLEGLAKHNGPVRHPPWALLEIDAERRLDLNSHASLEAQVAALADDIAYDNHDIDDGLRAGLLALDRVLAAPLIADGWAAVRARWPELSPERLAGELIRDQIGRMVTDLIAESRRRIAEADPHSVEEVRAAGRPLIGFSDPMAAGERALKRFMYAELYHHPSQLAVAAKARTVVAGLAAAYLAEPALMPGAWVARLPKDEPARTRHIGDFIAGMTDRYALTRYREVVGAIDMPDGI